MNQQGINQYSNYRVYSKKYCYDVSGYDENGNYISGTNDVTKYGGDGYIIDEDGNEKHIEVDWTGKGELDGYDEDGIYYELEVD